MLTNRVIERQRKRNREKTNKERETERKTDNCFLTHSQLRRSYQGDSKKDTERKETEKNMCHL